MTSTKPSQTQAGRTPGRINRFFHISERGSTVGREVRGGLVTFFAMSYIIVLNPIILSTPAANGTYLGGATSAAGLPAKTAAATALVAGVMSILMGVIANFPVAVAAGLGVNAMIAYQISQLKGMSYPDAMGLVVIEGVIILILVLTGFRVAVFKAVPAQMKIAISVGIGLFIALIGFVDSRFAEPASGTPLELGIGGSLRTWPVLVFVFGLIVAIILMARKVKGALLIAIASSTVLAIIIQAITHLGARTVGADGTVHNASGWNLNVPAYHGAFGLPNLSLLGKFSLTGAIGKVGILSVVLLVFSLMLADFFDTMGTMVAVGAEGGLLDAEGNPPKTREILVVDSLSAVAGGLASVSSNTTFVESAAGVGEGARTGLASVVTGLCFLASMFIAPLVEMVPYEAATPALVVVGFLMLAQVSGINWKDYEIAIPAFLTIIAMPFTYSITNGIGLGFISYTILKVAKGKARQLHPLMWIASALFVIYFLIGPIRTLLGV